MIIALGLICYVGSCFYCYQMGKVVGYREGFWDCDNSWSESLKKRSMEMNNETK